MGLGMSAKLRRYWEQAGGKLPDSWGVVAFESLFLNNKSIAVGVMYPGSNTLGGTPLLKVGDIKNGIVPVRPSYCISVTTNEEHKRTQLAGDELLITLVGNPGECVVATQAMAGWNPARAIAVVRLRDISLRTYLKAVLESAPSKHLIDAVLNTTVQKTLNLKDIRQLPIPFPPRLVIEEISSIADSFIQRIALLHEANATLEAIAQALFKSWFVNFDPVRAQAEGREPEGIPSEIAALFPSEFEDSVLGEIPKGWRVVSVGDVADVVKGKSYKSSELVESDTALVTLKTFTRGGGFRTDGFKGFSGSYKLEQVVKPGDCIVAYTDVTQQAEVIGRAAMVLPSSEHTTLVASLDVGIVRPKIEHLTTAFLYFLLRGERYVSHIFGYTSGTTVLHLAKEGLPTYQFILPPAPLLQKFEEVAIPMMEQMAGNYLQTIELASLRDTLLPRLMSGKLHISDVESALDEVLQ